MGEPSERGDIPEAAKELLTLLRAQGQKSFRLSWKGSKIPRGASVDGRPITWTQHGIIYVDGPLEGRQVGYYTRTKEWSGANGDEHEMLISTDSTVEAGSGQSVEMIRDFPISISRARS